MAAQYRTPSWYKDYHRHTRHSHPDRSSRGSMSPDPVGDRGSRGLTSPDPGDHPEGAWGAPTRRTQRSNRHYESMSSSDDNLDYEFSEFSPEDDKLDDGIEAVPSIRNLKSRFEGADTAPPRPGGDNKNRSRSPYGAGGRASSGDEDQVGYTTTTTRSTRVTSSSSSHPDYIDNTDRYNDGVHRSRPASKWDKPKEAPPPPINRELSEDEILAAEMPAAGTSRNIAARFRQYGDESGGGRDVARSGEPAHAEEELPPAEYTRSMLAKFRSIEDTSAPVPSPARSAQVSGGGGGVRRSPAAVTQHHRQPVNRPSPDSGISDSESQAVNGDVVGDVGGVSENEPVVLPDVVRESDRHDVEELPETGTTRSLLAQWRNMEQTVQNQGGTSTEHLRPKRAWGTPGPGGKHAAPAAAPPAPQYTDRVDAAYDDDEQDREVLREADRHEEDELPPPSTTRNMLAKFQEMQEEAQREAANLKTPPPSKKVEKQFKWTVREARPLFKGRHDSGSGYVGDVTNGYHDVSNDSIDHDHDEVTHRNEWYDEDAGCWRTDDVTTSRHDDVSRYEEDDVRSRRYDDVIRADDPVEENTPVPPQTTRSMLAMFQSLEDVNAPPPTPEYAQRAAKQAVGSPARRVVSIRRGTSPPPNNTHHQPRSSQYNNHNGHDDEYHSHSNQNLNHSNEGYNNHHHSNSSSSHEDLYGDYDRHGGEFENEPQRRDDVMRGSDVIEPEEELPEQGTTKNLLAKFQALTA